MMDDLTLAETAKRLRRNRELVRQWLKSGRLAGRKRAGRWFVSEQAVRAFQIHEPVRRPRGRHAS
jgi:predicted site-specific integrase-resolvase